MNMETLNNDVAKEVLSILYYCDDVITQKIPDDVLLTLSNLAADSDKEVIIDISKPLIDQNLSEEALNVFSALCFSYSIDVDIKDRLIKEWEMNDINM